MSKEIQVLFLDDEESIIDGIQRLFRQEPYGVFATTRLDQAREILEKEKIRVVISDQRMPQIAGVKFLREVKEKYPDTVRILFTGYTDFSAAEEAINLGEVYRFISKPWKTTELLANIRQAIEHYDLLMKSKNRAEELELVNRKLKAMYEIQKEFTSMVSHELCVPANVIKTDIDMIIRETAGEINSQQRDVLERVQKNAGLLKRLIDDLVDLTKLESGKWQMNFMMNDIHAVIQKMTESRQETVQGRGLYLKTEFDNKIPKLNFDSDRITQALNILLDQALAMTERGGITIRTIDRSQENHIILEVVDTGRGIAEENISKFFQKFQHANIAGKNETNGTGLELAICKEIINRHGGKIWVRSKPEEGTTFSFLLPIQERRVTP